MENPVKEISQVIEQLVKGQPSVQRSTLYTYFTPDAQFTHPFCKTWSFDGSRYLMEYIYRWYKVMSPTIELNVNSVAFDATNLILYVGISQNFRLWIAPFYQAPVSLTTVLRLRQGEDDKYYITSQDDLYQVDQFVRFGYPGFLLAWIVYAWWAVATFFCVLGALLFYPMTLLEEQWANEKKHGKLNNQPHLMDLVGVATADASGFLTKPAVKSR